MLRTCLLSVVLVCFGGVALAQIDCAGKPDGAYGHGCRSYTNCTNGRGTIVDCPVDEAFDVIEGHCRPVELVPPPCGSQANCTVLPDASYPVPPDCRYFFTCRAGYFMGSNPCNNPPDIGDLVFDYEQQLCNWRWDVLQPCGTYVPTTPSSTLTPSGTPPNTDSPASPASSTPPPTARQLP